MMPVHQGMNFIPMWSLRHGHSDVMYGMTCPYFLNPQFSQFLDHRSSGHACCHPVVPYLGHQKNGALHTQKVSCEAGYSSTYRVLYRVSSYMISSSTTEGQIISVSGLKSHDSHWLRRRISTCLCLTQIFCLYDQCPTKTKSDIT